jgi:hypothetical protein
MMHYASTSDTDPIQGGGRYVRQTNSGGEAWNFRLHRKKLYGYVQPARGGSIHIERLGASCHDETLTGVTVVWTAPHPVTGGTYVVGWYQNATVFRHYQQVTGDQRGTWSWHGRDASYHVVAAAADSYLLLPDARTLAVPRGAGGFGQSNVWYADTATDFVQQVRAHIAAYSTTGKPPVIPRARLARQPDTLKRLAVEQAAVACVWQHYQQLGYQLTSVEQDNVGWDLEAAADTISLRLEVKRLSGSALSVELTPNEYRSLSHASYRASYRICIVTDALTQPNLHIFAYIKEADQWISQAGKVLSFAEVVSARAYC